jgi:hypothetical protein
MSENMVNWNKLARPPKDALKQIQGGRLSGMTDIKPQWRYRVMTEVFGPAGVGWTYEIVKLWTEPGSEGQIFAFAEIKLYTRMPDNSAGERNWSTSRLPEEGSDYWSAPIPGIGGSMLVSKEQKGLHSSDEGFKMAVTDALSTALKMIGVGADVYEGQWDGSKWKGPQAQPQAQPQSGNGAGIEAQLRLIEKVKDRTYWNKRLFATVNERGIDPEDMRRYIIDNLAIDSTKLLDAQGLADLYDKVDCGIVAEWIKANP